MADYKSYLRCSEDEMKDTILRLYNKGYSIKYITKKYYKYKNLDSQPITVSGVKMYPAKIYSMNFCSCYVIGVIYEHILHCND